MTAPVGPHSAPQLVIALGEDDERGRREIAKAHRLLARGGDQIVPPWDVVLATRSKRARIALAGGGRRKLRSPQGVRVKLDGSEVLRAGGQG